MNRLVYYLIFFLLTVTGVGTCSCSHNTSGIDKLDGTHWKLQSINGNNLLENSYISLYFLNKQVIGYSGCNTYSGNYTVESPGKFRLSDVSTTLMACSKEINDQETGYDTALSNTQVYHLEDSKLMLSDVSGQASLVFVRLSKYEANPTRLTNTNWRLLSIGGIPVEDGLNATLNFDEKGEMSGTAGPDIYEFKYQTIGDNIWYLEQTVRRVTTAAAPTDDEAGSFEAALGMVANYCLLNGQLQMFTMTGDKNTLVFVPQDK